MITLDMIKEVTIEIFSLGAGSLEDESRLPEIADGRHAYWLAALYFGHRPTRAGVAINRHHASAHNSVTRCLYLCQAEPAYRKKVTELFKTLKPYETTKELRSSIALFRSAVDAML